MKIEEIIYQTPEMSEEKLLEIIDKNLELLNNRFKDRVFELNKDSSLSKGFLNEYDKIQDKKSYLTKSERDRLVGFVGLCMIKMTKGDD